MVIDRRYVLQALVALATATRSDGAHADAARGHPEFAAARRDSAGAYWVSTLDRHGGIVTDVRLPARGHDVASCREPRRSVAFARRPGRFAVAFDATGQRDTSVFFAPEGRHFYGHGVYAHDGRLLYATENDFDVGVGVIGVYDATDDYRRIGEFPSFGVGPHDIAVLRDGRTLVVANGGHREHPDIGEGRRILNAAAFETTLCYIDCTHGALIERHILAPGQQISFRHMAIADDNHLMLGGQTGANESDASVLVSHRRGTEPRVVVLGPPLAQQLAGYVSSIAVSRDGHAFAATSSKTGTVVVLDRSTGMAIKSFTLADVSGVAAAQAPAAFAISSGFGVIQHINGCGVQRPFTLHGETRWDNHLRAL